MLVASTAMLVAVSLSGCFVQETPDATSAPSPSQTPVFATEEEALAAATEAYEKYLKVSDAVFEAGGSNPELLATVALGAALESGEADALEFRNSGLHSAGSTSVSSMTIQSYLADAGSTEFEVAAYVCEDISSVDILDSNGKSLVAPNRSNYQSFEIGFSAPGPGPELVLTRRDIWEGVGVC